jgi:hypothetical protein
MVFPRQAANGREVPIGDTPAHERKIQVVCDTKLSAVTTSVIEISNPFRTRQTSQL